MLWNRSSLARSTQLTNVLPNITKTTARRIMFYEVGQPTMLDKIANDAIMPP